MASTNSNFAHRIAYDCAVNFSNLFFAELAGEECEYFLGRLWAMANGHEEGAGLELAQQTAVHVGRIAGHPGALLILPAPVKPPDVYFVAVVSLQELPLPDTSRLDTNLVRYFTLELCLDAYGEPGTVIGEWVSGKHRNHGIGPLPSIEMFLDALRPLLQPEAV